MVVEVASPSTARFDRTVKREVFDEWGIPTYWVVDPREESVQRHGSDPNPEWTHGLTPDVIFGG